MHVPPTLAIAILDFAFMHQSLALMQTNVPNTLVTLLKDVSPLQLLAMTEIFALLILAILAMDVSTPTRMLMTKTHVPKITATLQPELFTMMQFLVMIITHVLLILAMQQPDVSTLLLIL
jgi:hypothetical protein